MKKLQLWGLTIMLCASTYFNTALAQVSTGAGASSITNNTPLTNLNMGIGNTSPALKLDIKTVSTNDGIRIQQTGNTAAVLNLAASTGRRWALFSLGSGNSNAGNFALYDYGGAAGPAGGYRLFVQGSTGNVGIGTTTPSQKLQVNNGLIMVSGSNSFGGPMIVFSDNIAPNAYPNGRWGIEYAPTAKGLNFWKPSNPNTAGGGGNYYMLLKDDGKIGMGVTDDNTDANFCASAFPNGYRLYVKGGILTDKVKVAVYCSAQWADYVFAADYKLKSLDEVEAFVKANKHLPGVLSAEQMVKEGNDLGATDAKLLEKIEELTLYIIEQNKRIEQLEKKIPEQK